MLRAKRWSSRDGFSLIEAVIAIAVVAFSIFAILAANTRLQQRAQAVFERSIALQDANQALEQMRNTADSGTFPNNVVSAFPNNSAVPGFANIASEQVTVSYANVTSDPLDVTVTVGWLENGVRQVSATLRTLMTKRSP
ncbi:MAG: hypothetical protein A3J52_02795 [Omnitrophica bacterium RIFCSPHIGHO2_02_FULL_49_9]|nr:MAG: hypothetical protein A3J52_02795 [Omnitrophica bacterium RIFCSPHIGHO2_02_FULL_49_9]OGW89304.1 MAG: hypothetical protein A3A73_03580 [Omnitrophica bacterium RIFCSPLOWO2_01_FULL_50_24]